MCALKLVEVVQLNQSQKETLRTRPVAHAIRPSSHDDNPKYAGNVAHAMRLLCPPIKSGTDGGRDADVANARPGRSVGPPNHT